MDVQCNLDLHVGKWTHYMKTRRGTYEFRAGTRYKGVAEKLLAMGLRDDHLIVDVGAGSCQFDHYLRTAVGWNGRYLPVDAVIDGTDLETWRPKFKPDFMAAIEVVEHLKNPYRLIDLMMDSVACGVVLTTPNPNAVDVLACDPTHVSMVHEEALVKRGWKVEARSYFHVPDDTLLATFTLRNAQ